MKSTSKPPLPFLAKLYYHLVNIICVMAIVGLIVRFVPNPFIADNLFWVTIFAGAALAASYGLMDRYYPHPRWSNRSEYLKIGPNKKVMLYFVFVWLFYVFVQSAVFSGFPFLASFAFGSEGEQVATVENPRLKGRLCRGGMTLADYPEMLSYLCGLSYSIPELAEGDQIRLIGIKTIMGIRVQSIALVDVP